MWFLIFFSLFCEGKKFKSCDTRTQMSEWEKYESPQYDEKSLKQNISWKLKTFIRYQFFHNNIVFEMINNINKSFDHNNSSVVFWELILTIDKKPFLM